MRKIKISFFMLIAIFITTIVIFPTLTTYASSNSFTATNMYYKTTVETNVYTLKNGVETQLGTLEAGHTFQRLNGSDAVKHVIYFSKQQAYIYAETTVESDKQSLIQPTIAITGTRTFTVFKKEVVYDSNLATKKPLATVLPGSTFVIVSAAGSYYKVNISGKEGFIYHRVTTPSFIAADKYFETRHEDVPALDNSTGKLVPFVTLNKGQHFKIKSLAGNWITIQYGTKTLYVYAPKVAPSNGTMIKNATTNVTTKGNFSTFSDVQVMDMSSGKAVSFATIKPNTSMAFILKEGNWFKVNVGNRLGYVHQNDVKLPFKSTDKYMEAILDKIPVYRSKNGVLTQIGALNKGQKVKRLGTSNSLEKVQWGNETAFVRGGHVRPPYSTQDISNVNSASLTNSKINMFAPNEVNIYDISKTTPQIIGTITPKEYMALVKENRQYWTVLLGGRIAHVLKEDVVVGPIISHSNYSKTFTDVLATQMSRSPQTDAYRSQKSFVHGSYLTVDPLKPAEGIVNTSTLNIRELPNTQAWIVGKLARGVKVKIIAQEGEWYEVTFGPWKNAKQQDVANYLNPDLIKSGTSNYFQFLLLSKNAGMRPADLDSKLLFDKGILANKGRAFVEASYAYNINEAYLISHALLETGNGKSELANGVLVSQVKGVAVTPKKVYNMFGIQALDSCPLKCGSEYAYEQGWFTPELAIMGGAKFISERYINHPTYKQDTLYKMRWNPADPGQHQYATDIAWAAKQTANMKKLYDLIEQHTLYLDIPHYK